jgi:phosphohistidine phosphatase
MKTLYLIRHAKSSWDNHDISDFERDLNQRGKQDAPLMAKIIRQKKIRPDLIISSPAVRAINTANIFAGILDYPVEKIEANEKLYDAGLKELTDVVRNIDDDKTNVMLFGHNPGIATFGNLLCSEQIKDMPTCSIVGLELNINSWKDTERYCGKNILFEYPKKYTE